MKCPLEQSSHHRELKMGITYGLKLKNRKLHMKSLRVCFHAVLLIMLKGSSFKSHHKIPFTTVVNEIVIEDIRLTYLTKKKGTDFLINKIVQT